jgi:hypothetical protein
VTAVLVALATVVVIGWPLAFALTGRALLGTLLAPLTAGLVAAVSAVLMIVVGGRLVFWLVPLALASFVVAFVVYRRQLVPSAPHAGPVDVAFFTVPLLAPAIDVLQSPISWDSHAIYWTRAGAFTQDSAFVRYHLGDVVYRYSHTDYPPLVPASVATGWATGGVDFFSAQFVTTALTLSAIVMLAYAVRVVTAGGPVWASRVAASAVALGVWTGAPLVLAAGYTDHLWTAAAVAGGLLLLLGSGPRALPVVLLTVAALTKNEGLIAAGIVAVVVTARTWRAPLRAAPVWVPVGAGVLWSVVGRVFHAESDLLVNGGGERIVQVLTVHPTMRFRFDQTVDAMWSAGGKLVAVAAVVAVVGALLLRPYRTRIGIGADWPLWAVLVLFGGALVFTYLISPHRLTWHLPTSIDRTMVPLLVLASVSAACWAVTAVEAFLRPSLSPVPSVAPVAPVAPVEDGPARFEVPRQRESSETTVPTTRGAERP